jgi:hypothetical protein
MESERDRKSKEAFEKMIETTLGDTNGQNWTFLDMKLKRI